MVGWPHDGSMLSGWTRYSRTARLANLNRFDGMRRRDVRRIVRAGRPGRVRADRMITVQDGPSDGTYILLTGTATVTLDGKDIGTLVPGDLVGEIALLEGRPRTASVTADQDLDVLFFPTKLANQLLAEVPPFRQALLDTAHERLARDRARRN
jgi:CRP/FNR family cyclic AMP-dependent transcriptional regulator